MEFKKEKVLIKPIFIQILEKLPSSIIIELVRRLTWKISELQQRSNLSYFIFGILSPQRLSQATKVKYLQPQNPVMIVFTYNHTKCVCVHFISNKKRHDKMSGDNETKVTKSTYWCVCGTSYCNFFLRYGLYLRVIKSKTMSLCQIRIIEKI